MLARDTVSALSNKRLKLTGVAKWDTIPFVHQVSIGNQRIVRRVRVVCSLSLSAVLYAHQNPRSP